MSIEGTRFYTLEELCRAVRVTRKTIMNELKAGNLKSYKAGNQHRFTDQQIVEWLESKHERTETS